MKVGVKDAIGGGRGGETAAGPADNSAAQPLVADYPGVETDTQRSPQGGWNPRAKALFLVAAGAAAWGLVFVLWTVLS